MEDGAGTEDETGDKGRQSEEKAGAEIMALDGGTA